MSKRGKISNHGDLQDLVCDIIMSQKGLFDEDEIVNQIYNSERVDSGYDSNALRKLVIEKILLLMRLDDVKYSQEENKYFVNWPKNHRETCGFL